MSFSFDFSDNDSDEESAPRQIQTQEFINPLSQITYTDKNQPKFHSLNDLLSTLKNTRFTFKNHYTPKGNIIYRRELYDVKHQLMLEENENEVSQDEIAQILLGDSNEDVKKDVYEGGLKSWECSFDAVDYLSEIVKVDGFYDNSQRVLELGCGTGMPSCFLLQKLFSDPAIGGMDLVLSDFNYSVLRLVTLPNLIINWASTLPVERLFELCTVDNEPFNNDELLMTEKLVNEFTQQLVNKRINISFISGAWCNQMIEMIGGPRSVNLLITSETIYDPFNLKIVGEMIIELLSSSSSLALVVAKDFYFGVGGSVNEFLKYLNWRIGSGVGLKYNLLQVDSNLKRSIIEIKK